MSSETKPSVPARNWRKKLALFFVLILLGWFVAAYILFPDLWKRYAHRHPAFEDMPGVTYTADGIPADPINVALVGTKTEVLKIMLAAKWYPADPLTLRSSLEIAAASVFKRSYEDAPVSSEFLFGRKQDLAFEQAVGDNPRHRHHVRMWSTEKRWTDGRPIWIGAAVFDERVGLSRTTGQITHITDANVDKERDLLFADLKATGELSQFEVIDDFHKIREGRNGEGVRWFTDGNLYAGVIASPKQ